MAQGRINFGIGFTVDQSGLNQLKQSLASLQQMGPKDIVGASSVQDAKSRLQQVKQTAEQVELALQNAFNPTLNTTDITKFKTELLNSFSSLDQLRAKLTEAGAQGSQAFRQITNTLTSVKLPLKETHSLLQSMQTTFLNTVKWSIASSAINAVTSSVQKAWSFTKELDKSLNDIMLVTEKSSDEMAQFAVQANKAARALKASTTEYTNAALIYYQQGLSDEEVAARASTTTKAANVTGQSADAVSEQLTAVWNGYKVSAQETELYIDKLAAVAASTAADLEELSTGMSKVASAANNMGVDIDQLNAMLATTISVTRQAPETVGTAFKTIFARISDIEAGQDGETTLGEYTKQMAQIGFNVLDANGKIRDMGEVIEEIGSKWSVLTREQQISLAQTMAGTRQYNNLLALFENWDMYTKSIRTSSEAVGFLQEQQDEYAESMEAHLQDLKTAGENLYIQLLDPDSINFTIDQITKIINGLAFISDSVGGMIPIITVLGSALLKAFSGNLASWLVTTWTNIRNTNSEAQLLKNALVNIGEIKNTSGLDKYSEKVLTLREQLIQLKQAGVLTNEEFNAIEDNLLILSNQANNLDSLKENLGGMSGRYEKLTKSGLFTDKVDSTKVNYKEMEAWGKDQFAAGKTYNSKEQPEFSSIGNLDQMSTELKTMESDTNTIVDSINKKLATLGSGADLSEKEIKELQQEFEKLDTIADKVANSSFSEQLSSDIKILQAGIKPLQGDTKALAANYESVASKVKSLGKDIGAVTRKTGAEVQAVSRGTAQILNADIDRAEQNAQQSAAAIEAQFNNMKATKAVKGMIGFLLVY